MANPRPDLEPLLRRTTDLALEYLASLDERHVGAREDASTVARRLRRRLPSHGEDPRTVVEELARDVDPGLVASAGPRYFGFVVGGAAPAWATRWDSLPVAMPCWPVPGGTSRCAGCTGRRRSRSSSVRRHTRRCSPGSSTWDWGASG